MKSNNYSYQLESSILLGVPPFTSPNRSVCEMDEMQILHPNISQELRHQKCCNVEQWVHMHSMHQNWRFAERLVRCYDDISLTSNQMSFQMQAEVSLPLFSFCRFSFHWGVIFQCFILSHLRQIVLKNVYCFW